MDVLIPLMSRYCGAKGRFFKKFLAFYDIRSVFYTGAIRSVFYTGATLLFQKHISVHVTWV
jgi:hypothetical protein